MNRPENTENGFPIQNSNFVGRSINNLLSNAQISPKTPEQDDDANKKRMAACIKAPKAKFIGPPIIKTKIQPQDSIANGTGSLESKTVKSTKTTLLKRVQSSNYTAKAKPISKGETSLAINNTTSGTLSSTVQISKGITMKRLDKIVPANDTLTTHLGSASRNQNMKAHSKLESGTSVKKPEKTKTQFVPKEKTAKVKLASSTNKPNTTPSTSKSHVEPMNDGCSSKVSSKENSPLETYPYKTLEEFLVMPEMKNGELNAKRYVPEPEKPKPLFKSQFWEYLDPHKKHEDDRYAKSRDKEKAYDPVEVKSYMEKQKEIRRLKEAREYKERQQELERKKKQLQDLNDKCRSINARSLGMKCKTPSTLHADIQPPQSLKTTNIPKSRHSEGSTPDYQLKSPVSGTRSLESSNKLRKGKYSSEQDLQATILLKEFEDIVKKECMQVLKHHMKKSPSGGIEKSSVTSTRPKTSDKAVETTFSLENNGKLYAHSKDSSTVSSFTDDAVFIQRTTGSHRMSQRQLHLAAAKIQAAYRGYQTRKILRESNIIPYLRHKKDARCRRRMSFYRTPEKACESPIQRRISFGSPARIPANVHAFIPIKEPIYTEPPSSTLAISRHLMPASLRLKPFDEPFPKEVIEKIQQQKQQLGITKTPIASRFSSEGFGNISAHVTNGINGDLSGSQYRNTQHSLARHFASESPLSTFVHSRLEAYKKFDAPAPTIAEVLKEKVRAFSQELQTKEFLKDSLPKKSASENYVPNWSSSKLKSRYKYDSDFESYSEPQTNTNANGYQSDSKSLSSRLETLEVPEKDVATEGNKKRRSHDSKKRKSLRKTTKYEDSTTTVDTDLDLVSNTSRDFSNTYGSPTVSQSNSEQKTNGTALSSTTIFPTSSINMHSLPTPALELCYKAEVERMQVLEKAYLCTQTHERNQQRIERQRVQQEKDRKCLLEMEAALEAKAKLEKEMEEQLRQQEINEVARKEQMEREIQEIIKRRSSPQSPDVNLALMNCQKEALNATAEITKFMADLKKSSVEKDLHDSQQQPINLASMVYAAVDEARRRDEEKRQKRREIEKRRALKERELEKEKEREKLRLKELAKGASVTYHDKQIQFPSSSMGESSRPPSVQEVQSIHHRPESARKSEMRSVNKAQGQLEKQLQEAKKMLQGIHTDEDISDNLSEPISNSQNEKSVIKHVESYNDDRLEQSVSLKDVIESGEGESGERGSTSVKTELTQTEESESGTGTGREYKKSKTHISTEAELSKSHESPKTHISTEAELSKSHESPKTHISTEAELSKSYESPKVSSFIEEDFSSEVPPSDIEIEESFEEDIASEDKELKYADQFVSENLNDEELKLTDVPSGKEPTSLLKTDEPTAAELSKSFESFKPSSYNQEEDNIASETAHSEIDVQEDEIFCNVNFSGKDELFKLEKQKTDEASKDKEAKLDLENERQYSARDKTDELSIEIEHNDNASEIGDEKLFEAEVLSEVRDETLSLKVFSQKFKKGLIGAEISEVDDETLSSEVLSEKSENYSIKAENLSEVEGEALSLKDEFLSGKAKDLVEAEIKSKVKSETFGLEVFSEKSIKESIESDILSELDDEALSLKNEFLSGKSKGVLESENLSENDDEALSLKRESLFGKPKQDSIEVQILSELDNEALSLNNESLSGKSKDVLKVEILSEAKDDALPLKDGLLSGKSNVEDLEDETLSEIKDATLSLKEQILSIPSGKSMEKSENLSETLNDKDYSPKNKSSEISDPVVHKSLENFESHYTTNEEKYVIPENSLDDNKIESKETELFEKKANVKDAPSFSNLSSEIILTDGVAKLDKKEFTSITITDGAAEEKSLELTTFSNISEEGNSDAKEYPSDNENEEEESFEDDISTEENEELGNLKEKSEKSNEESLHRTGTLDDVHRSDETAKVKLPATFLEIKPSVDIQEVEDMSTEVPHSDTEMEVGDDSFEDDTASDVKDKLLKSEAQSLADEAGDEDKLTATIDAVDNTYESMLPTKEEKLEKEEIIEPELSKSPELVKPSNALEESEDISVKSPHIDIEVEDEEWFEDEMVSDGKDDGALKLNLAEIEEARHLVEKEIRALEALQAQVPPVTHRSSLSLSDIPDKPPPPYSPPSSDSFSVSSRSCVISLGENKIKETVIKLVNDVWYYWCETRTLPVLSADTADSTGKKQGDSVDDTITVTGFQSLQQTANQSFDSLLVDFIRKTIGELLLVDNGQKSYIDKVRPGPMALQAQKMRIPKSKEDLADAVLAIVKENIPLHMIADSNANPVEYGTARNKRLTKWSSRPRDLVDEVLVEELIQENSEWTEVWPEELIVVQRTFEKTLRRVVHDVVNNIKTAFKQ